MSTFRRFKTHYAQAVLIDKKTFQIELKAIKKKSPDFVVIAASFYGIDAICAKFLHLVSASDKKKIFQYIRMSCNPKVRTNAFIEVKCSYWVIAIFCDSHVIVG